MRYLIGLYILGVIFSIRACSKYLDEFSLGDLVMCLISGPIAGISLFILCSEGDIIYNKKRDK